MKPILLAVLLLGLYGGACLYLCLVAGVELGLVAFVASGIFLFYVVNGHGEPKPLEISASSAPLAGSLAKSSD